MNAEPPRTTGSKAYWPLQFSMKSLLIVLTIMAAFFAGQTIGKRAAEEERENLRSELKTLARLHEWHMEMFAATDIEMDRLKRKLHEAAISPLTGDGGRAESPLGSE